MAAKSAAIRSVDIKGLAAFCPAFLEKLAAVTGAFVCLKGFGSSGIVDHMPAKLMMILLTPIL